MLSIMPTAKNRLDRINEEVMRELAKLLPQVKDPRVSGPMLSIIRCETTNDLRWCKVYLSVYGEYDERALRKGLLSCSGFLRYSLARAIDLRYTPELVFMLDDSIAHGAHISKVLDGLDIKHDEQDEEELI